MASVGTGLPNAAAKRTRREGKWIVVDEGFQKIPGVDFFISPINLPRLLIGGREVPLTQLAAGSVIRLDVERVRRWQWLLWRYFGVGWRKE